LVGTHQPTTRNSCASNQILDAEDTDDVLWRVAVLLRQSEI